MRPYQAFMVQLGGIAAALRNYSAPLGPGLINRAPPQLSGGLGAFGLLDQPLNPQGGFFVFGGGLHRK